MTLDASRSPARAGDPFPLLDGFGIGALQVPGLEDALSAADARTRWAHHPLVQRLLVAVKRDDLRQAEALVRVLLSEGCSLTALCDDVLRPLLGQLQADGSSSCVLRRSRVLLTALLSRLRGGALPRPFLGSVALACPQGAGFLDSYMVAVVMEARGWRTVQLGAVFLPDVDELAAEPPWPAAVVLAVDDLPLPQVRDYCRRVHSRMPGTVVVAHGRLDVVARVGQATGVDLCSSSVGEAAQGIGRLAAPLSDRELAILAHVSRGLTNKQVAALLSVAPSTVKSHLDRIFHKLDCADRASAVAHAVRSGWIA